MSFEAKYQTPSPLQKLSFAWAKDRNLTFFAKRDDLIHDAVSGNKWRKLKFNLLQASHLQKKGILTFGGAFSNHILATAHACWSQGLKSMAVIRGDELSESSNDILRQCNEWGMQFRFITREEYNLKDDFEYLNELKSEFRDYYIVPEGGKNFFGMVGCQEIIKEIDTDFDALWTAQGTCTTSIGLAMSCKAHQSIHGVPALKGYDAALEIETLMKRQGMNGSSISDVLEQMQFHPEYHFGGYGKITEELKTFIGEVWKTHKLPLDKIYTAKAFYAMIDYYRNNDLQDQKVVFLHTGGLIAGKV